MSNSQLATVQKTTFRDLLAAPETTLRTITEHLDRLDSATRIAECRQLNRPRLARLFELAASAPALTPDEMVDGDPGSRTPVPWYGRNSLMMFVLFEKHFVRHEGAIVGINVQSNAWFTGPGYYSCRIDEARPTDMLIDYTMVPATAPPNWPKVRSNKRGFSRFIYHNMYDYCRRVSPHVVIGAATRLGKPIGAYFVLCRA